jgi:hypoxanthine phosphoribosyltransferase
MEFIRAKCSMKNNEEGSIEISGLDLTKVKNRHVIVVEDVVITGGTLSHVVAVLKAAGCTSLKICALLEKRITAEKRLKSIDYIGFSVPNLFLVGHGLDYADSYRECADIWVLSSLGKEKKGKT